MLWGNPPSTSQKGVPPSQPHQGPHFPQGFPKVLVGDVWGCVQLSESDLPAEILHDHVATHHPQDPQGLLAVVVGVLPLWVGVARG